MAQTQSLHDGQLPTRTLSQHTHAMRYGYLSAPLDDTKQDIIYTTRNAATYSFLTSIYMKKEKDIITEGKEREDEMVLENEAMIDENDFDRGLPENDTFSLPERDWRGYSYKLLFKSLQDEKSNDKLYKKGYLYDVYKIESDHDVRLHHASNGHQKNIMQLFDNTRNLLTNHDMKDLRTSDMKDMRKFVGKEGYAMNIELSTIALAIISFERLCFIDYVTKDNMKLAMAVCLLLAFKFNEPVNLEFKEKLEDLLEFFQDKWQLSKKQVLMAEFGGYVSLGFTLHVPHPHTHHIYKKLLEINESNSRIYLKDLEPIYAREHAYFTSLHERHHNKHPSPSDQSPVVEEHQLTRTPVDIIN